MKKFLLSLSLVGSLLALAEIPKGWTDDFEAAKKQAATEKKDLLVDFSGSDWCGWCKKLDKEVFSLPEFTDTASKDFVLVLVDSPRDSSILSETAKKQNPGLVQRYKIEGFPTVLLLDSAGQEYARTGYQQGGPAPYLKSLAELRLEGKQAQAALAEINKLQGTEKAKAIETLIAGWPLEKKTDNHGKVLVQEMLQLDPTLKAKYPYFAEIRPIEEELDNAFMAMQQEFRERVAAAPKKDGKPDVDMKALGQEFEKKFVVKATEALEKVKGCLAQTKLQGEELQMTKLFLLRLNQAIAGRAMSKEQGLAAYREAYEAAPESKIGQQLGRMIKAYEASEAQKKAEAAKPAETVQPPAAEKK